MSLSNRRILVACEQSGRVRDAFARKGWDAWSCDLLPSEKKSPKHIQDDVLKYLVPTFGGQWDMMIAFPPCTYLCSSGLHWNKRLPNRQLKTNDAIDFFMTLARANIPRICIENPVGIMSTFYKKPTQYINHYEYGEDASKKTGLWLKNLPVLVPEPMDYVQPRIVEHNGKKYKRWGNQTDSGQNKLTPSPDRWKLRSVTPVGIAEQMSIQWGDLP